jgi:hypothetical protein
MVKTVTSLTSLGISLAGDIQNKGLQTFSFCSPCGLFPYQSILSCPFTHQGLIFHDSHTARLPSTLGRHSFRRRGRSYRHRSRSHSSARPLKHSGMQANNPPSMWLLWLHGEANSPVPVSFWQGHGTMNKPLEEKCYAFLKYTPAGLACLLRLVIAQLSVSMASPPPCLAHCGRLFGPPRCRPWAERLMTGYRISNAAVKFKSKTARWLISTSHVLSEATTPFPSRRPPSPWH